MLKVQTEKQGIVTLKHFSVSAKHVKLLTEIVQDEMTKNMSLSCTDADGRQMSVLAFQVNVDSRLLRQMNVDIK